MRRELTLVNLIPLPLLPGKKGSNVHIINGLAPLPWERGWGEVKNREPEKSAGEVLQL
jgi:hypothetical protein